MPALDDLVISRTTAAQQIADALSDMILRGELAPGAPLRESALASQLGVSRNTVREAVRILEQGGLVQIEIGRGAVARRLDQDEIAQLYGVREVLELTALRESNGADLAPVRTALAALEQAARKGSEHETVERDHAFHASIVGLLGNGRLDRFFADICAELRFCLAVISHVDEEVRHPAALVEQHAAVLRALDEGNRRRAVSLMREHIRFNAQRVGAVLRTRQAGSTLDS
jgi:DNA-binding GntR family transcriptional regulator